MLKAPAFLSARSTRLTRLLLLTLPLLSLLLVGASPLAAQQDNNWQVGSTVFLCEGTQFWQSPTLLGSCYVDSAPERNWEVTVLSGPRLVDGRTWYQVRRGDANDPASVTGWVNKEQADACPATRDEGRFCPPGAPDNRSRECLGKSIVLPQFLFDLQAWWSSQAILLKVLVLGGASALILFSGRLTGDGNIMTGLIRALAGGVLAAGLADLTRGFWTESWDNFAGGNCGIDPAMMLLVIPVIWWVLSLIFRAVSTAVAVISSIVSLLFLLGSLFPDRFNDILAQLQKLLPGG